VLPILDGNLQRMTPGVKVSNDGRHCPIAIPIDDIATIAVLEQLCIEPAVIGPGARMRSDTGSRCLGHLLLI
jgi:hypothetical protein